MKCISKILVLLPLFLFSMAANARTTNVTLPEVSCRFEGISTELGNKVVQIDYYKTGNGKADAVIHAESEAEFSPTLKITGFTRKQSSHGKTLTLSGNLIETPLIVTISTVREKGEEEIVVKNALSVTRGGEEKNTAGEAPVIIARCIYLSE